MKKLFSDTIIYGIGAILPRVITFLLNPFYIHHIDREEFAQFTNLYSWVAFVNILLTFGFETTFFRYSADKNLKNKVFNTSFWFLAFNSVIFLLLVLFFNQSLAHQLGYSSQPEYLRFFAYIAFFDTLCVIPLAYLRFKGKAIQYSVIRVFSIFIQTLAVISFFIFIPKGVLENFGLKEKVSYTFYSNIIGSFVTFILVLPIVLKVRWIFDFNLLKKMLSYSYPILLAGFAFMINENFDKIIQFYEIPKKYAGAYGGCYKLAVLMTLFVTAYRMGIEPFFFKEANTENAKKNYAKVTNIFTIFSSIAAMGIIANIDWLKRFFITDSEYWIAIDIVPVIILANLCFGIYFNFSTWYKVTDRTIFGGMISWVGALITIVFNLLFLQKFGFMVSAWVTLLAYFVMMCVSYFLGQKYYPIPYNIKKIISILSLLFLFSYLSSFVFDYHILIGNLFFIIFILIVYFLNKTEIKNLLKR